MAGSSLIEIFGQIAFSFTRNVTDNYNPEEPEFTAESFGLIPVESTGREWYYYPVDELIYREYGNTEVSSTSYLAARGLNVSVINACSTEEHENILDDHQEEEKAMAWKRLRPSFLQTVCKAMYIGALISLLSATVIGIVYVLFSYLCYKTIKNCTYDAMKLIPLRVQWTITISDLIGCGLFYIWSFSTMAFLFRRHQLKGLKRKLILICFVVFFLDAFYRVVLQTVGKPFYKGPVAYRVPLYAFFASSLCLQFYYLARNLCLRSRKQVASSVCKLTIPSFLMFIFGFAVIFLLYPMYNRQNKEGRLLIAVFAPVITVIAKAISRICVQRLWNITHPGYSYVLLVPIYFGSAVLCRVLQADLDSLESIATLGILHGIAEVVERSTMVVIDHFCHVIWKRTSAPWGSFRTPRRERLMADIAIISMLFESTAIVSVNGFLYLYQFIYLQNNSFLKLLQSFAIHTSIPLVIEWFFTSTSLAIETRYQNMPVMAVWRRQWRRHLLVALVNAIPIAMWTSGNLLIIVHGRFNESSNQPCKMPFT